MQVRFMDFEIEAARLSLDIYARPGESSEAFEARYLEMARHIDEHPELSVLVNDTIERNRLGSHKWLKIADRVALDIMPGGERRPDHG